MFDSQSEDGAIDRREQAAVLAIVKSADQKWTWHRIAEAIEDLGSALAIVNGDWSGFQAVNAAELHASVAAAGMHLDHFESLIEIEDAAGAGLVTVLDSEYPANLRAIGNRPPFVFIRGGPTKGDERSSTVRHPISHRGRHRGQADQLFTSRC
ncbi:MAG: hypothetical protein HKN03_09315 [Acidimicrobiales bacterium]|nr:hypothetical protein [Acidimicrobiales bacterium]